ncbi:MAG: GNAT family N-acetyltransferase [Cyclobacteriaceae bacterium]|nr:GNAT family N-acetyltransferase [Cyclobacteriaceae bacterium]
MIEIRDAIKSDINSIVEFQINMAEETENMILHEDVILPGVEAVFGDHHKGHYYIAEYEGDIAGSLLTTYEWSDWRNGTILWIQSVYVKNEYRGKGVFKAMYKHIQEKVETNPDLYKGIRLYVDKTNLAAQKVYSSVGMNGEHYQLFETI